MNCSIQNVTQSFYNGVCALPKSVVQCSNSILAAPSAVMNYLQPSKEENCSLSKYCFKHVVAGASFFSAFAAVKAMAASPISYPALAAISFVATLVTSGVSKICKSWEGTAITVISLNLLSSFNDCLEFAGDLGDEKINGLRNSILELLTANAVYAKKNNEENEAAVTTATGIDQQKGATVSELFTDDLKEVLTGKLRTLRVKEDEINTIFEFIGLCNDKHLFSFFRTYPGKILGLENILLNNPSKNLWNDLPVVNTLVPLDSSKTEGELLLGLMDSLFTEEIFNAVTSEKIKKFPNSIEDKHSPKLDYLESPDAVQYLLKKLMSNRAGVVFLYYLHHSINLSLVKRYDKINSLNEVKTTFNNKIANEKARDQWLEKSFITASVVFTQELTTLAEKVADLFHSFKEQNQGDGTHALLRKDTWKPDYEKVSLENNDYNKGKGNIVIATHIKSKEKYFLASLHGDSKNAENGRTLLTDTFSAYEQKKSDYPNLKLIIGMDANTKNEKDLKLFDELLESKGLKRTKVGNTTNKCRTFTTQIDKLLKVDNSEGDFIITLKDQAVQKSAGKGSKEVQSEQFIPNPNNISDHYMIWAKYFFPSKK